jgi:hypothetical protein
MWILNIIVVAREAPIFNSLHKILIADEMSSEIQTILRLNVVVITGNCGN